MDIIIYCIYMLFIIYIQYKYIYTYLQILMSVHKKRITVQSDKTVKTLREALYALVKMDMNQLQMEVIAKVYITVHRHVIQVLYIREYGSTL